MSPLVVLTAADQVTAYLRDQLMRGTWHGVMPGGDRLAAGLGIGRDTVEVALQRLEKEGFLVNQGRRRGRLIVQSENQLASPKIRVAILISERADLALPYIIDLQHELVEAGHLAFFPSQTSGDLCVNVKSAAKMVRKTEADAWVVAAGSREVLEWFIAQEMPVFALFGRRRGLKIAGAGPDKVAAYQEATRELIRLGHRRIVMLAREARRLPMPGTVEQAYLDELAIHGFKVSEYNLPNWTETVEGFNERLRALFQVTPPTALIVDEAQFFNAVLQFCASRGLRVPQDVSLVCTDANTIFDWNVPSVAHIRWDSRPLVRRIVRWVTNLNQGKMDARQTLTPAKFVTGGTLGRVREE